LLARPRKKLVGRPAGIAPSAVDEVTGATGVVVLVTGAVGFCVGWVVVAPDGPPEEEPDEEEPPPLQPAARSAKRAIAKGRMADLTPGRNHHEGRR
jgi:hypothetical protein